jgi:hypothetical protein
MTPEWWHIEWRRTVKPVPRTHAHTHTHTHTHTNMLYIYHNRRMCRGHTARPPSPPDFNPLDLYLWEALCIQLLFTTYRHFTTPLSVRCEQELNTPLLFNTLLIIGDSILSSFYLVAFKQICTFSLRYLHILCSYL